MFVEFHPTRHTKIKIQSQSPSQPDECPQWEQASHVSSDVCPSTVEYRTPRDKELPSLCVVIPKPTKPWMRRGGKAAACQLPLNPKLNQASKKASKAPIRTRECQCPTPFVSCPWGRARESRRHASTEHRWSLDRCECEGSEWAFDNHQFGETQAQ